MTFWTNMEEKAKEQSVKVRTDVTLRKITGTIKTTASHFGSLCSIKKEKMFCILHHKVRRKVYWPQRPVEAVNAIHYRPII